MCDFSCAGDTVCLTRLHQQHSRKCIGSFPVQADLSWSDCEFLFI